MALDLAGVMVSAGSACSSGKVKRSHVLDAMGVAPDLAESAIRISLGWSTTEADIDRLVEAWGALYARTRSRSGMSERPIYLDYQATTPTDPRVVEAMLPYFTEKFGNPGSATHAFGREAERAVETARAQLAALIGAEPREIVFTSGATESNNLALKGAARFHRPQGQATISSPSRPSINACSKRRRRWSATVSASPPRRRWRRPGRSRNSAATRSTSAPPSSR